MTRFQQGAVVLYLVLLISLAALGTHNQLLYREQRELINRKSERLILLTDLRGEAASVTGPAAVRAWALARGMTSPEGQETFRVAPLSPPDPPRPPGGLEIRTIWR